jgi:hypothetical protein
MSSNGTDAAQDAAAAGAPSLLPCPFCGNGEMRVMSDGKRPATTFWMIVCEARDCTCHPFTGGGSLSVAAARWNRRAPTGAA